MADPQPNSFSLGISHLGVEIHCPDPNSYARLVARYQDFLVPTITATMVQIIFSPVEYEPAYPPGINFDGQRLLVSESGGWGWLSPVEKKGELYLGLHGSTGTVDYYLRAVFALLAFEAGGFMLHAAGVINDERVLCFFGHSGSGKTTVSRYSPPGSILNDDLLVLLPTGEDWIVHATPFTNPTQVQPANRSAPLKGLYRLVQDRLVYVDPLEAGQALAELYSCLPVIPADPERSQRLISRLQKLLAKFPVYSLHFRQDSSFWSILK